MANGRVEAGVKRGVASRNKGLIDLTALQTSTCSACGTLVILGQRCSVCHPNHKKDCSRLISELKTAYSQLPEFEQRMVRQAILGIGRSCAKKGER